MELSKIRDKNIMVIGAHPDDWEFYAGGTLIQLSRNNSINIVVATDGKYGFTDHILSDEEKKSIRLDEQLNASRLLRAAKTIFLDYTDGTLEYSIDFRNRIIELFLQYKPDIVFSFDPYLHTQEHPDHRILAFTVLDAVFMTKVKSYLLENFGEVVNTPALVLFDTSEPNLYVDISNSFEIKLKLNSFHKSQYDEFEGWSQKAKVIAELAEIIAAGNGMDKSEAFRLFDFEPKTRYTKFRHLMKNN